jgi:hypothetical protein
MASLGTLAGPTDPATYKAMSDAIGAGKQVLFSRGSHLPGRSLAGQARTVTVLEG